MGGKNFAEGGQCLFRRRCQSGLELGILSAIAFHEKAGLSQPVFDRTSFFSSLSAVNFGYVPAAPAFGSPQSVAVETPALPALTLIDPVPGDTAGL